jgi:hypothetical protein
MVHEFIHNRLADLNNPLFNNSFIYEGEEEKKEKSKKSKGKQRAKGIHNKVKARRKITEKSKRKNR